MGVRANDASCPGERPGDRPEEPVEGRPEESTQGRSAEQPPKRPGTRPTGGQGERPGGKPEPQGRAGEPTEEPAAEAAGTAVEAGSEPSLATPDTATDSASGSGPGTLRGSGSASRAASASGPPADSGVSEAVGVRSGADGHAVGGRPAVEGGAAGGEAAPARGSKGGRPVSRAAPRVLEGTARPEGGGRAASGDVPAPGRQWPLLTVLGIIVLALLVIGFDPFRQAARVGALLIGAALLTGATLRRMLPAVGMLAVRSRFTDVITYGVLGGGIVLLALMTQPDPWLEIPFLKEAVRFTVR